MLKKVTEVETLRVAAATNSSSLAGTIVRVINGNKGCELVTIGAGACNQAMKAVAIANRLLGSSGISLSVKPCFSVIDLSNEKRDGQEAKPEVTALKFKLNIEE